MAQNYKILGQVASTGVTDYNLYTTPSGTQSIISTLSVCNAGAASSTYRIAVRPSGEAISQKHYIAYDATINQYDSTLLTLGVSLSGTDVVTVNAASGVVFNLFGVEIN